MSRDKITPKKPGKRLSKTEKGCSKTEVFVPGHLLLPLSRDKGTPGQEFFLSRDKGTTGRPVPVCPAGRPVPLKP